MKFSQVLSKVKAAIAAWIWSLISNSEAFEKVVNEMINKKLKLVEKSWDEGFESLSNQVSEMEEKLTPEKIRRIQDPNRFEKNGIAIRFVPDKKDYATFHFSKPLFSEGVYAYAFDYPMKKVCVTSIGKDSEVTERIAQVRDSIFDLAVCESLGIRALSISVRKTGALSWDEIIPQINEIFFNLLAEKSDDEVEAKELIVLAEKNGTEEE
ncbi:MAG: hypothetical protein JWM20_960 [Patescibacteria group bacterium]|nr:hypothetical protein [Patescibacteria group bacterium]